ncbi:hypothetical protein [Shimia sp. SDUM112013]|uniref:hypothetical protein n=1 Tax=Shimia sp. SDUM112013 TaxID=3136160 RepID=UPI0032ED0545
MKRLLLLGSVVALTGCDPAAGSRANATVSPNIPPAPTGTGVSVSGSARVGVTYSSDTGTRVVSP